MVVEFSPDTDFLINFNDKELNLYSLPYDTDNVNLKSAFVAGNVIINFIGFANRGKHILFVSYNLNIL